MTTPSASLRGRLPNLLGVTVIASLLAVLALAAAASAATGPTPQQIHKWQQATAQLRLPGVGCFTASYPTIAWLAAPCKVAPNSPYEPAQGHRPQIVGNGDDYSAEVSGSISSATGSFDSVSAGSTESGIQNGTGSPVANTFSLQLNAKPFATSLCSTGGNPSGCLGWAQFVYSTTSNEVYIQYWLERYDATCPSGWTPFSFPNSTDIYCYTNSPASSLTGSAPTMANLASVTLTGSAASDGTNTVVMTTGSGQATASDVVGTLNFASGWKGVEFALVGDCCDSQANLSAGTAIAVRTTVHSGSKAAPTCVVEGFTGETNSLNLVGTPAIGTQASPTIVSQQTQDPGTAGSCAAAGGIGDTHLTTFRKLLYDYQASGDFVLVSTRPGFTVQTRQVSGAPTWPDAAVNQAIATRVGTSDVTVCSAPARIAINGRAVDLPNGVQLNLSDGGDVTRYSNVYLIRGGDGDSVRATVNPGNPSWINVSVGLGTWPVAVRGLLANAGSNVNAVESRGGLVLSAPFAFNEFYERYGQSWRVPAAQSLLSPCGERVASGVPRAPFYASDLKPEVHRTAQTVCLRAGVKAAALLDACTIDVAVLGNKRAATAYVGLPAPATVAKITTQPFSSRLPRYNSFAQAGGATR